MIDEATYTAWRAAIDKADAWIDTQRGKNGWASYRTEDAPHYVREVDNAMRGAVEVYELHRDKPARFLAYVESPLRVTTWTGDTLGYIVRAVLWRDRHGSKRYAIRVRADWGGTYHGQTQGAGMCVTLRRRRG